MKPYLDTYTDDFIIREFDSTINPIELMWHRDLNSRYITVLSGDNWKLQIDNQLPIDLNVGETYFIPKLIYHRLILGNNKLKIKILEI